MNKNDFQENYKMAMEILTPVNIANNIKLNPKEYLYDVRTSTVYFLNQIMWHKFIYTNNLLNKYEEYMLGKDKKNLYQWLQSCGYSIDDVKVVIKSKAFAHVKEQKNSLNEIICQSKLVDGSAYIPGSSIKGVIRTAILYDLLLKNQNIRIKYWNELSGIFTKIRSRVLNKKQAKNIISKNAQNIEIDLLHGLNVFNKTGDKIGKNNAVCSVMRGINVGDSEPIKMAIPLEILQKIDIVLIDGKPKDNPLSVFRECILPKAKFNFQLKLNRSMTKEIGINSIEDLIITLQNYFDFVNETLKSAFGKEYGYLFNEVKNGNIYLGSNTGFLTKTLIMALVPTKREAVNFIRNLLEMNFKGKNHAAKDTKISPRTLKTTKYKGRTILMGVARIYKDE